jgi:hypothetical protein
MAVSIGVAGLVIGSLLTANGLYDRQVNPAVVRFLGSATVVAAVLAGTVLLDKWVAVALSVTLASLVLIARVKFSFLMRGVHGEALGQSWAEVSFAASCAFCVFIGWGLMDDPAAALVPLLFVAWADSLAGLVRRTICAQRPHGIAPSLLMLVVCLAVAMLFVEASEATVAAVAAATVERTRLVFHNGFDDNWLISSVALLAIAIF